MALLNVIFKPLGISTKYRESVSITDTHFTASSLEVLWVHGQYDLTQFGHQVKLISHP
jgi:hypothetical protein